MFGNIQDYKKLIGFQGELMEHLYDDDKNFMSLIKEYMFCSHIAMLVCDTTGVVEVTVYGGEYNELIKRSQMLDVTCGEMFQLDKEVCEVKEDIPAAVFDFMEEWDIDKVEGITSISGEVNHYLYSVVIFHQDIEEIEQILELENIIVNNIQICVENRIFHKIVAYESEHDLLTKLYNRRSYFRRAKEEYPLLASVGVLYFDVNNLKLVNDNFGHDAGDALLQKAAESIRSLTSETVHGYRMGGDEFIVVAMNCTRADIGNLLGKWEKELEKVNHKYGGYPCVVAVGSAFAKGSFAIEEVCQIADKRMYQDKKRKKIEH